jgi:hypothetical protein
MSDKKSKPIAEAAWTNDKTRPRIVLIGCGKSKADTGRRRVIPTELYTGSLFQKRAAYAERRSLPWAVLSAKYGLVWSDTSIQNYDLKLDDLAPIDRAAWAVGVVSQLLSSFDDDRTKLAGVTIEIHAGRQYADTLSAMLTLVGFKVEIPTAGLGIGDQLGAYTTGWLARLTSPSSTSLNAA